MSRILSNDSSSKYSLSHSSKSVLTVSGLQFTTTVLLPSWRSVRMLETAHQSNSTLLPARRQKSGQGKDRCTEENKQTFSAFTLKRKRGKKANSASCQLRARNPTVLPWKLIIPKHGLPRASGKLAQLFQLLLPLSWHTLRRTQEAEPRGDQNECTLQGSTVYSREHKVFL